MKHSEDALHKQISQYLSILQNQGKIKFFTYLPFGEKRNYVTGALLKAKGTKRGVPDFMVKNERAATFYNTICETRFAKICQDIKNF
jgi:hypothetical protein